MNFGIISIKKCPCCKGVLGDETMPAVQSPRMRTGPVDGSRRLKLKKNCPHYTIHSVNQNQQICYSISLFIDNLL
jgi:hypothetical protein